MNITFFKRNVIELSILLFLLFCSIALFHTEINVKGEITERERGLFNAIEFGLAIAIGWQSQRISSKEEFLNNLKQFALSAYRRIKDIDKSISWLDDDIVRLRAKYSQEQPHELDIIRTLTRMMNFTVQSSIADWSDLIGDEVMKHEKLELLQREEKLLRSKQLYFEDPKIDNKLNEMAKEITKLRSELPNILQYDYHKNEEFQQSGDYSERVFNYFNNSIIGSSIISLSIFPNQELLDQNINELTHGNRSLFIRAEYSNEGYSLKLFAKNEYYLGVIKNPLFNENVSNNDFAYTLIQMLGLITGLTDTMSCIPIIPTNFVIENVSILIDNEINPRELVINFPILRDVDFAWG